MWNGYDSSIEGIRINGDKITCRDSSISWQNRLDVNSQHTCPHDQKCINQWNRSPGVQPRTRDTKRNSLPILNCIKSNGMCSVFKIQRNDKKEAITRRKGSKKRFELTTVFFFIRLIRYDFEHLRWEDTQLFNHKNRFNIGRCESKQGSGSSNGGGDQNRTLDQKGTDDKIKWCARTHNSNKN